MENLKKVVYREKSNKLNSIMMPDDTKDLAQSIWDNGYTIFNNKTYLKKDIVFIGEIDDYTDGLTLDIHINNMGKIVYALDEKGTRHQPQYRDYANRLLSDNEHLQMFKLRFGYKVINQ